ncbi:MAG: HlyD family efflux transporter periplasmic adaptor subunit, partial [Chloroflexi bacterium]|nr:HlyD family efflux transporter periplasmic adaptor subunit [Chloroflexota bacterium]
MSKRLITIITLVTISVIALSSCAQPKKEILPSQMAAVTRGDLILSVSSDGNLDMPNQVRLKFGTPGTVKDIPAEQYKLKGKPVKAGTLLATLDDTTQLLTVKAAQYAVEQAINSVIQGCCGPRSPTFYSLATALMRFEQAQAEVNQAKEQVNAAKYADAASNISLATYDLEASRSVYSNPELDTFQTQYNDMNQPTPLFPELIQIVNVLDSQIAALKNVQQLLEAGDYPGTSQALDSTIISLAENHTIVKNNSRLPGVYTYPDTSTSLAISRQVLDALSQLQLMLTEDSFDRAKASEKLLMAEHDLLMSNMILNESETIYRAGLNPQTLRNYNINIETAMINLDKAKQELLKTEIIAPFDGTIVAVDVKVNDQLSQFDYSSKTAVYLVDTKTIRMTGIIDEIDITRVAVGQDAILTVDALPGQKLKGSVRFVSPFGTLQAGVVNFPVEIYLDKSENVDLLRGGLTATADIITGKRDNVLMVPNRAIKGLAGDFWVDVVTNASTATTEKRPVKTGLQNKKSTEIIS